MELVVLAFTWMVFTASGSAAKASPLSSLLLPEQAEKIEMARTKIKYLIISQLAAKDSTISVLQIITKFAAGLNNY
jgi:hypothetical protein